MNKELSRTECEYIYEELVQAQNQGLPVTLSQIAEADEQWQQAAQRENLADLHHRLYDVGGEFETLYAQRKKARDAYRVLLRKQEELRQLVKKIEIYIEGVDLKLSVAAVEESEVLALLDEAGEM